MKYFHSLRLPVLICMVLTGLHHTACSQTGATDNWQIGFGAGYTNYYGDASNYRLSKLKDIDKLYKFADYNKYYIDQPSWTVLVQKRITPTLGFMIQANAVSFSMSDRYRNKNGSFDLSALHYARSLNFKTSLQDAGIAFTFNTNNGRFLPEKAFFSPSFFIGMGVSRFTVKGDLYNQNNERYDYGLPGNIQDGTFETDLRNMRTETSNRYSNVAPYADLGLGLNFRLSDGIRLSVQSDIKYSASDYLDDISGQYKAVYANPEEQYVARPGYNAVDPLTRQRGDNNGVHDIYINNRVILGIGIGKKKAPKPFTPPALYSLTTPYSLKTEKADTVRKSASAYRDSLLKVKADSLRVLTRRNDSLITVIDTTVTRPSPFYTYQTDSLKRELQTIQSDLKDIKTLLQDQQVKPRSQQLRYQADSLRALENKISSQRIISREDNLRIRIYQLQTDSVYRELEKLQERTELRPAAVIRKDTVVNNTGQQQIDSLENKLNELENKVRTRANADTTVYNQAMQKAERTAAYNRAIDSETINKNLVRLADSIKVSNDSAAYLKQQLQYAADSAAYYDRLALPVNEKESNKKKVPLYKRVFQSRKSKNKEEVKRAAEETERNRLAEQQSYYQQQADRTNGQIAELQKRNRELSDQYNDLVSSRETIRRQAIPIQTPPPAVIYQNDANRSFGLNNKDYDELLVLKAELARLRSQVNDANRRSYNNQVTPLIPVAPVRDTLLQQSAVPVRDTLLQPAAPPVQVGQDSSRIELLRADLDRLRNQLDSLRTGKPVVSTREVITSQKFDVKSFPVVSVYFRSGSAVLTSDQIKKITPFAQVALKNPTAKVQLKGFTDPTGNPAVNQAIAKKRSEFVRNILTATFNIDESRIVADEPVAGDPDKTKKPNPLDRRVDLEFN